ncbi:MAG: glycosyltransferase family 2 protein [Helicobacteraceae bacterium]|jgi:glycosyltransferase involved in cell wall biosynthesis|nr:glycosyltransferase family 2 protein [Helicobacteraceae bacterium]
MIEKTLLSVAVITFNEEENLARTLKAVKPLADEIIVVDSHSTDRTREIALNYGAKVFDEDWKGHIAQKNSALEKCVGKWIFSIDADEVLSAELAKAIAQAIAGENAEGFIISRKSVYLGKTLNYMWRPDRHLRLVKRDAKPRWSGYNPHDILTIEGKTAPLKGDLIHYSYKDLSDHWRRLIVYARLAAESYAQKGRRFSLFRLLFNPLWGIIKTYIFRLGFLDGIQGLLAAFSKGVYIFLKYAFLFELQLASKKTSDKNKDAKRSNNGYRKESA